MDMTNTLILGGCGIFAFLVAWVLGKWLIPWLHKLKFGQTILEDGPTWHQKKQGTPTMGGILFISAFVLAVVGGVIALHVFKTPLTYSFKANHLNGVVLPPLLSTAYEKVRFWGGFGLAIGCGLIGFLDDYIKVVKKRNKGLSASQKLFLQLLLSTGYAVLLYLYGGGKFNVPFIDHPVNWGVWYIPFTVFVIVAMSNATNLTDGVDGLCGSTGFVAALSLLLLSGLSGHLSMGIPAVALAGGLAGFLLENTLSDNGGVTRGLCQRDERNLLTEIVETKQIRKSPEGPFVQGEDGIRLLDGQTPVSMNMWAFTPDVLDLMERSFIHFLKREIDDPDSEFLIPTFISYMLHQGIRVYVAPINGRWFGMTYSADTAMVQEALKQMAIDGLYPDPLF